MNKGQSVAAEALQWVGTPFRWQASVKGVGCDCKGLLWGVARELGLPEAETFHAQVADYGVRVPVKLLKQGMSEIFDKVQFEDRLPGDVMLLRIRSVPMHLAIFVGGDRAVHAQIAPTDFVKQTQLSALLAKNPLDSMWRWRDGC